MAQREVCDGVMDPHQGREARGQGNWWKKKKERKKERKKIGKE